ncbi:MAG: DUF4111 domain-containing protein [Dehalococcoidales bacterium]|nr:MAG: DUF4111 domain-containing protein [Dehalococcoidales bacterium]
MEYKNLPSNVQKVCDALVDGLKDILRGKLHGIYMYGAAVFPDSRPITDIDCHVILKEPLNDPNREEISRLYGELAEDYPPLGDELDVWYILLSDARKNSPPLNQLKPGMRDDSWALHCAHVRACMYITLYGPEPDDIFPAPSWEEITAALDHEMEYIKNNLRYPAYCVLNLCRIMYSFHEQDVVISKRFSGIWAGNKFPEWDALIQAALRTYGGTNTPADEGCLQEDTENFLEFALKYIEGCRGAGETDAS